MQRISNLHRAHKNKKDEFYTQLQDIEDELKYYQNEFFGKTILCNCDDPKTSNFFKYFRSNFTKFGLKRLISTCYKDQRRKLFTPYYSHEKVMYSDITNPDKVSMNFLEGNGDFRSSECIEFLKESDIVITNPPFSLFREFIKLLVKYDKKFIILGNINAITYKEVFKLIKENKLAVGVHFNQPMTFTSPYNQSKDNAYITVPSICWFQNLQLSKKEIDFTTKYSDRNFQKYDNYDAINIDKVKDIPFDYNGLMGVPITFLKYYNSNQFKIVGLLAPDSFGLSGIPTTKNYNTFREIRQDGLFTKATGSKINGNPILEGKPKKGVYYINEETKQCVYSTYARILIKKISKNSLNSA